MQQPSQIPTLNSITEQVSEVNTLGKNILKLSETVFSLPEHSQRYYAQELLSTIVEYYSIIDKLKKNVIEYRQNEKNTSNLTIKKLERDLLKF